MLSVVGSGIPSDQPEIRGEPLPMTREIYEDAIGLRGPRCDCGDLLEDPFARRLDLGQQRHVVIRQVAPLRIDEGRVQGGRVVGRSSEFGVRRIVRNANQQDERAFFGFATFLFKRRCYHHRLKKSRRMVRRGGRPASSADRAAGNSDGGCFDVMVLSPTAEE